MELSLNLLDQLTLSEFLVVLVFQRVIFCLDFILQLRDLVRSNLELASKLRNLVLSLNQVLRIEVSVRSHGFVKVLLLL